MNNQKMLSRSLDKWLWFIIRILPILCFFVSFFSVGTDISFVSFVNTWSFTPVAELIDSLFLTYLSSACPISGFISYLILVDIIRIVYYVVSFMPLLASNFVDKMSRLGGD